MNVLAFNISSQYTRHIRLFYVAHQTALRPRLRAQSARDTVKLGRCAARNNFYRSLDTQFTREIINIDRVTRKRESLLIGTSVIKGHFVKWHATLLFRTSYFSQFVEICLFNLIRYRVVWYIILKEILCRYLFMRLTTHFAISGHIFWLWNHFYVLRLSLVIYNYYIYFQSFCK